MLLVAGAATVLTSTPAAAAAGLDYQLLRNGTVVATVPGWKTTARVAGLAANTTASYAVRSRLTYNGVTRTSANSVSLSVTTNSSTAPAGGVENGATMALTNDLTHSDGRSLTMDLFAYDTNENATIKQWYYNSANNQRWKLTAVGNGTYTVASGFSNKCLSPLNGSTAAGTAVVQVTCNGSAAQQWTFTPITGVTYQIKTAAGTCIGAQNNSTTYDTPLVLAFCSTGQPSQRWTTNRLA